MKNYKNRQFSLSKQNDGTYQELTFIEKNKLINPLIRV